MFAPLRWISTYLLFFALAFPAWSQEHVKISKGEFRTGIETGFKEAWNSIKEGDKNYKAGTGTYDIARDHYLFAQQYNSENAHLNYKLGVCYLFTDDKYRAIDYFRKAYALDTRVSKDIHYLLGQAFQLVLEFDKAVDHYKMHMEVLSPGYKDLYAEVLEKRMEECKYGRELALKPVRVILKNPGTVLNSKYDDYNPVFAFGDTALFFTSRRPFEKSRRNEIDNKFNEDIYLS